MESQIGRRGEWRFVNLVLGVLLAVMLGYLLRAGQGILVPVVAAIISVYVLASSADAMGRTRLGAHLPIWLRRTIVLLVFIAAVVALATVTATTIDQMRVKAPAYQVNLERLATSLATAMGLETSPDWQAISKAAIASVDVKSWLSQFLTSAAGTAGTLFLVIVYAIFLMVEREAFAGKLGAAFPDGDRARVAADTIARINAQIGDYLAVKTLVNVILAVLSYAVLAYWRVDFALFWALAIGLLNYIPYVGSLLGVLFPVVVALAQFGSVTTTLMVAGLLTVAQFVTGNVLEPRMIGQRLNLSPFVVLVALSIWSALWGLAGAILAIPLTSALAIILSAFPSTRPLAVLLAADVSVFAGNPAPALPVDGARPLT